MESMLIQSLGRGPVAPPLTPDNSAAGAGDDGLGGDGGQRRVGDASARVGSYDSRGSMRRGAARETSHYQ